MRRVLRSRTAGMIGAVLVIMAALLGGSAWGAAATRSATPGGEATGTTSGGSLVVSRPVAQNGVATVQGSGTACPAIGEVTGGPACWPGLIPYIRVASDGTPQGVTATGQASVKGQGTAARDQAIQLAIADARHQAETAARAAGISLGAVIDMQISAPGYPYPVPLEGTAGASSSGVPAGGVASASAAPACPPSGPCVQPPSKPVPAPIPVAVQTYASVTVTWAIAG